MINSDHPSRRTGLAAALTAMLLAAAPAHAAAQTAEEGALPSAGRVLVVSRVRVLEEIDAARHLSQEEAAATERLQREIDEVKAELTAEEEELTRLRETLPREEFEARVAAFDERVRDERRSAQNRAAVLQQVFRDARRELVDALGQVLETVRVDMGAVAIVNADAVLAHDPVIDATDRVIELFNQTVAVPVVSIPQEPQPAEAPAAAPPPAAEPAAPAPVQ